MLNQHVKIYIFASGEKNSKSFKFMDLEFLFFIMKIFLKNKKRKGVNPIPHTAISGNGAPLAVFHAEWEINNGKGERFQRINITKRKNVWINRKIA